MQAARLTGAQLKIMGVAAGFDQGFGLAQIAHDLLDKRRDGGQVGGDAGHLGLDGQGAGQRQAGKGKGMKGSHGMLSCGNATVIYVIS